MPSSMIYRCVGPDRRGSAVISVDTKKKELVGEFKNGGREVRGRRAHPVPANWCIAFMDPRTRAERSPYGVDRRRAATRGG